MSGIRSGSIRLKSGCADLAVLQSPDDAPKLLPWCDHPDRTRLAVLLLPSMWPKQRARILDLLESNGMLVDRLRWWSVSRKQNRPVGPPRYAQVAFQFIAVPVQLVFLPVRLVLRAIGRGARQYLITRPDGLGRSGPPPAGDREPRTPLGSPPESSIRLPRPT